MHVGIEPKCKKIHVLSLSSLQAPDRREHNLFIPQRCTSSFNLILIFFILNKSLLNVGNK